MIRVAACDAEYEATGKTGASERPRGTGYFIEAGTGSVEWVTQEFARADLSDKRLDRRLMKTAQHLAQSPAS
ncbi:MAG: IS4/Tn5 family transposase DNA-binding protein, partial [Acidiferrobacterales bacterium]